MVALVTGGAHGLGRATCRTLAAQGVAVLVVDEDEAAGRAVAAEVGGAFFGADVACLEDNRAMVAAALERFGRLDAVLLNAGVAAGCGIGGSFDVERYRRVMGANADGVVFGVHAALEALEPAGGGSIVVTASLAGLIPMPTDVLYGASKHAAVGLVRSLGPGLRRRGIRLNAVCPGFAESRLVDPYREALAAAGVPIMAAQTVADAVVDVLLGPGTGSGECWYVQSGHPPGRFAFGEVPDVVADAAV